MITVLGAPQVYDNLIGNLHRHHVLVEKVPENHEHVNLKTMNQVNNKEMKYPESSKNFSYNYHMRKIKVQPRKVYDELDYLKFMAKKN